MKIRVVFEGIEAEFYVTDDKEFRYVEGNFIKGYLNENIVLKYLIEKLRPGDIAFDIGSNMGIHAILMAKRVGKNGLVIAFEPEKGNFNRMEFNIKLNSLNNLITYNLALGDNFAEGILYHDSLISGIEMNGQRVRIVPGDSIVREDKLPTPNIVKIDVEGYEYHVIRGLKKTLQEDSCRILCCEVHPSMLPDGITSDDIINLLNSYGFNRIEIHPRGNTFHAFCSKSDGSMHSYGK